MPRDLLSWGVILDDIDVLLDLEREAWLRKESRSVAFDGQIRRVESFALIWVWYDRLCAFRFGLGEERIKHYWQACMAEERLDAPSALIRVIAHLMRGYARAGVDIVDINIARDIAQKRMARWRDRRARRNPS